MTFAQYTGLVGATIIFVWSPLFKGVRWAWPEFLSCPMCVGFWVGFVGSVCLRRTVGVDSFLDACVVSVAAWALYLAGRWVDEH